MIELSAAAADFKKRLDRFLQEKLPEFSRSRIQDWIREGRVTVNGASASPALLLKPNDRVAVEPAPQTPLRAVPEAIPLTILYEDGDLVAVDKPAGMVVHAGAGVRAGTLVNALLARFDSLSNAGGALRPGIVHRLDRYTSGVLLVAKHDAAHRALAAQFAGREVSKVYLALVHGAVPGETGRIEKPVSRDPVRRIRMTARLPGGRAAVTAYRVLERPPGFTFLEVRISTGRTHQIRVHLSDLGHPVVGDPLYGAPRAVAGMPPLDRYFLHAHSIRFRQPSTGREVSVSSPLTAELETWKNALAPARKEG